MRKHIDLFLYSLGLILLELATGVVLPGTGESWEMLRLGDFSKQKGVLSKLSLEMSEMIEWLLTTEAKERPTVQDIMQHPSFVNAQSAALQDGPLLSYVQQHTEMESNVPPPRLSVTEANVV